MNRSTPGILIALNDVENEHEGVDQKQHPQLNQSHPRVEVGFGLLHPEPHQRRTHQEREPQREDVQFGRRINGH